MTATSTLKPRCPNCNFRDHVKRLPPGTTFFTHTCHYCEVRFQVEEKPQRPSRGNEWLGNLPANPPSL